MGIHRATFSYILRCRLSEPGLEYYSQGSDMYQNQPVEIVDITDVAGQTVTVTFNQVDKLPVRQVFKRRNPQFKDFDTEVSVFAKYREYRRRGEMALRRSPRAQWGKDLRRCSPKSVEINKNLTDDLFTLPAGMKMLPKPK